MSSAHLLCESVIGEWQCTQVSGCDGASLCQMIIASGQHSVSEQTTYAHKDTMEVGEEKQGDNR